MNLQPFFTTDEEMEELVDSDVTTSIVGFIDSVTAPGPSGKKKDGDILFKFRVSNCNKKINVLIWDIALINKFLSEVCINRVININGGHCHAINKSRFKEENNIVPFEIIIKENTSVSFMGYYLLQTTDSNVLQKVTFDDIHTKEGLIEIKGYVRTPFALVHNRSGLTTYGIGAITDGVKKITIQVKQFVKSDLEIGDSVTVKGTVKGEGVLVIIFCDTMDDVKLNPEIDGLSLECAQRGGRPVKRSHKK